MAKRERRAEKKLRKAVEAGKDGAARELRKVLETIAIIDGEIAEKELERKAEPAHVPAGAPIEKEKLKYVRENENMFVDQTKIAACQIETWMMQFFARMGHGRRPGTVLEALFEAAADIIPEPENGILRVRILGLAGKAMDKAVVPLLEALNRTETKFPDTELQPVYELPGRGET